ncbi:ABC transporter permease subunit [Streptococcus sobrinus]|uniref:ABC transporter permease subunit n=1 Tax=Streptococcus sobrinus TaxID=1310 RepID=UPI00030F7AE0|nr:ABC transporter permease subunit [Streptococcus sobrinus]
MILLKHELKEMTKGLLIWSISVGLICAGCILLYKNLESQLSKTAQLYANMGDMTKALGMDKISLATLNGYFATEIVLMFGLGSTMFASMIGTSSLAKEEEGHTSEFLYSLPFSRWSILGWKLLSILLVLVFFNVLSMGLEALAIWWIDLDFSWKSFLTYHGLAFIMQIEIVSLTFLISAISRKKQLGLSIGLVLVMYVMDLMCRIIPDIKNLKYWTPFYLANGSDIFSHSKLAETTLWLTLLISFLALLISFIYYQKKDLSA